MRILHVLNFFLPDNTGGTEVYSWALSKQLQKQGHVVKIIMPHYGSSQPRVYVYDGLEVYQYPEPSIVDRSLIMGYRLPDGLTNFVDYLRNEQPDIVHFHELAGSNGITVNHVKAAKSIGLKVVFTFHLAGYSCKTGTMVYMGKELCDGIINLKKCSVCFLSQKCNSAGAHLLTGCSMLLHNFSIDSLVWNNKLGTVVGSVELISRLKIDLHDIIENCDKVVAIADWYKKVLLANGVDEDKIKIIRQGLPTLIAKKEKFNWKRDIPIKLMFLGRISHFKGLHLLLEAIEDIDESMVELSIFGKSTDLKYETDLKTKTLSKPNVFWHGELQQDSVCNAMRDHDLLCLCSTFSEMSPLVIQEALHVGLPVLASGVYGNLEQITHGHNGLIFQFNNADSIKDLILRVIKEIDLLSNLRSYKHRTNTFDMLAFEYVQLYDSILKS